jgi:hypothetical protein
MIAALLLAFALAAEPDVSPAPTAAAPPTEAAPPTSGAPAPAPSGASEPKPWDRTGWGWGGLPAVNFNSDEGAGFGVVGSIYRYDGGTQPYRTAINLVIFATSLGVHQHSLEVDALRLGNKPIRLTTRAELQATRTSNYCGLGNAVTCDPAVADAAADAAGLTGQDREDFLRRFYRVRFVNPNLRSDLRVLVAELDGRARPTKVELLAGYRANLMLPGDFSTSAPFPGSQYAVDFPGGEQGLASVLQLGVMLDSRDNEPSPTQGIWAEATARGSHPILLSDYSYAGFNLTFRGYVPLGTERLVFANRVMFDGMAGDAHTLELLTPGGTQRMQFWGNLNSGRGIRLRRYVGRWKAMTQPEVRWTYASPTLVGVEVDLGLVAFADLGFIGLDTSELGSMWRTPLPSTGGGLRFAFEKNFVIRADVGVSPIEDWAPSVYIDLRNLY